MNEENKQVPQEAAAEAPKPKRRSLWWLNLIVALVLFLTGVFCGIKLYTTPEAKAYIEPFLPAAVQTEAAAKAQPEVTPKPTESAKPTETPKPTESAKPTETPKPTESAKPTETPKPTESAKPTETPKPTESAKPAFAEKAPATEKPLSTEGILVLSSIGGAEGPQAVTESPLPTEAPEAEGKPIGIDAALDAALRHAGLSGEDMELDAVFKTREEDGTLAYQVEFRAGEKDYLYLIEAMTGEVDSWKSSRADAQSEAAPAALPQEAAVRIACEHAGVRESEISNLEVQRFETENRCWYGISFEANGHSHFCILNANDGSITMSVSR